MSLEAWLEAGLVVSHEGTPEEIADLFEVAEVALRDAAIAELSSERKLGCAYGAILSAGRAALCAAGYRVPKSNPSHHHYVIQSLRYTVGLTPSIILQIEALQKKRNTADYVRVGEVSDALAANACALAREILESVREWGRHGTPEPDSRVTHELAGTRSRSPLRAVSPAVCAEIWFVFRVWGT